jgi:hypothetical protein
MLDSTAGFGQERTSTTSSGECLKKTKEAQPMELESRSPDGKHRAKWYGSGELWMSGPEWGFLELDDSTPCRLALPEFKWSVDSAYFAFVYVHDEHVTTRQGIEGLSLKIRIVRLCDGQVRHLTGSRDLAPVSLTEFDSHHLTFTVANHRHTAILGQLNWTGPHKQNAS